MTQLCIDAPGDGAWVMERVSGFFSPEYDHVVSARRGGRCIGGIVLSGFLGNSVTVHMAGDEPGWCSRDLLWMVFDYAFNQLGACKVIGPVRSDNYEALAINLRGGFRLETVVRDVYAPGAHMMVLSMTRETCPWLKLKPQRWMSLEVA